MQSVSRRYVSISDMAGRGIYVTFFFKHGIYHFGCLHLPVYLPQMQKKYRAEGAVEDKKSENPLFMW